MVEQLAIETRDLVKPFIALPMARSAVLAGRTAAVLCTTPS